MLCGPILDPEVKRKISNTDLVFCFVFFFLFLVHCRFLHLFFCIYLFIILPCSMWES